MTTLAKALHDACHVARVHQGALGEPLVVDDAELREIGSDVLHLHVPGEREHPFVACAPEQGASTCDQRVDMRFLVATGRLVGGHAFHQGLGVDGEVPADIAFQRGRDFMHVRAAIAVRGKRDRYPPALEVTQPHAQREDVHLAAGVVDVVLALHVESGRFEDVGDACAVRGTPAVSDVQRAGGVRGDELHLDAPAIAERRARSARAVHEDAAHHLGERPRRDAEVDEARAGNRDRRDGVRTRQPRDDEFRDLSGPAPCDTGEGEGDGTREIAVIVTAAALDGDIGQRIERELPFVAKRRQRVLQERSDMLLH